MEERPRNSPETAARATKCKKEAATRRGPSSEKAASELSPDFLSEARQPKGPVNRKGHSQLLKAQCRGQVLSDLLVSLASSLRNSRPTFLSGLFDCAVSLRNSGLQSNSQLQPGQSKVQKLRGPSAPWLRSRIYKP